MKMSVFTYETTKTAHKIRKLRELSHNLDYRQIPKYSDTRNIAVIILKFKQSGFIIG